MSRLYDGLLFVGDPHISSRRPGRRVDEDFSRTVRDKLEQAARIANERNLLPIILGDLFDRGHDSKPAMLAQLIRSLSVYEGVWLSLVGNHDVVEHQLTDDASLTILKEARIINVKSDVGHWADIKTIDGIVSLVATPWGMDIADDVAALRHKQATACLMFTHHDIAFEGETYPGVMQPFEIYGCDMVVNGHMHKYKPANVQGQTTWFNPGNITRMKVDEIGNTPAVWAWSIRSGLERIPLSYQEQVFDMTGISIEASKDGDVLMGMSQAALAIKESHDLSLGKTDDGTVLKDCLTQIMLVDKVGPDVAVIVNELWERAVV
jgi:hypothetical protein